VNAGEEKHARFSRTKHPSFAAGRLLWKWYEDSHLGLPAKGVDLSAGRLWPHRPARVHLAQGCDAGPFTNRYGKRFANAGGDRRSFRQIEEMSSVAVLDLDQPDVRVEPQLPLEARFGIPAVEKFHLMQTDEASLVAA